MQDNFSILLVLTEECNFNCEYCYVNHKPGKMSKSVIYDSIRFIIKEIAPYHDTIYVRLFGGEPLLAENEIKYATKGLFEFLDPGKVIVTLFTNLSLVTEEFLLWAKQYPYFNINLSLDGCKVTNDIGRVYPDGTGTYDDILNKFKLYKQVYELPEDFNIYERCVYVLYPGNISKHMQTVYEYNKMGVKKFITAIVKENTWDENSIAVYKNQIDSSVDFYIQEFPKTGIINQTLVAPILEKEWKRQQFCGAARNEYTIDQNGIIWPCQRFMNCGDKFIIGNINDGIDKTSTYYGTLNSINMGHIKKCRECELFPGCASQCLAACHGCNGSIFKMIDEVCQIHKINYSASERLWSTLGNTSRFRDMIEQVKMQSGG